MEHLDSEQARAFIAGELDRETQARWAEHLTQCPRCAELVKQERSWPGLLRLAEDPPDLEGGAERLLQRLADFTHPRRRASPVKMLLALLLGLSLGALGGYGYRLATPAPILGQNAELLGISPGTQKQLMDRLDALETLEADPWLLDNYEAARWLALLLREEAETREGRP